MSPLAEYAILPEIGYIYVIAHLLLTQLHSPQKLLIVIPLDTTSQKQYLRYNKLILLYFAETYPGQTKRGHVTSVRVLMLT